MLTTDTQDAGIGLAVVPFREAGESARRFAKNSWILAYEPVARSHGMERRDYFRVFNPLLDTLLAKETALLVTLDTDPDMFVGWACGGPGRIHWAFVKLGIWRRRGTAAMLLRRVAGAGAGVYTFRGHERWIADKMDAAGWRYDETHRRIDGKREQGTNDGTATRVVPAQADGA